MTSVQNHRPPLSGSKYIAIIVCISLWSCNIMKSNPVEPPVNKPNEEVHTTEPKISTPKKHVPNTEEMQEVFFHGESYLVPAKKTNFKIALILPFHLGFKSKKQQRIAEIMLDYYKGMKMALAELEAVGLNATISIYDNKNDSNELKRILRKREIYKMDLIVGPIQESQVKIVSRVLKPYKIPVFSPFTSIDELTDTNPLLYSFVGGSRMQAKQLVEYLVKNHPDEKLVILRDGKSYDREFVPALVEELEANGTITYVKEAYQANVAWAKLLPKDKKSVVFVASKQQNTVQNCLGGLIASKRDVSVFGESTWMNFRDNDFMFWDRLNMHLIASEYAGPRDSMLMGFRTQFREEFKQDPSNYAFRAYDQINFIGDLLLAFGEHFPEFIDDQYFAYSATAFQFVPYKGCRQNKNQFVLRYENHQLEVVE